MKNRPFAVLIAAAGAIAVGVAAQPTAITIVLTGQSMIRSDLRATKPAAVPAIRGLLSGARAGYILERLSNASKPFGTTLEIHGETASITVTGRWGAGLPARLVEASR